MKSEMVNLNCEVIRDLIPLSSEGLCSETSAQEVKKHIASCERCRMLYENIPAAEPAKPEVPDESRAFRKVRKKMKRSLLRNVLLSVALAAVVVPVGVLTYGQIVKDASVQSFETVWQSFEVRQLTKMLTSGDIEGYMTQCSYSDFNYLNGIYYDLSDGECIRQQDKENLMETYKAAYGDTEPADVKISTDYNCSYYNGTMVAYSHVIVTFENGKELHLGVMKDVDGAYSATAYDSETDTEAELAFKKALNFLSIHELVPRGWFEELLLTGDSPLNDAQINYAMPGILERFQDAYDEQVEKSMSAFYQKDYLVEDCILTLRFDEEKEMLYYETVLIAEDTEGTAVMNTKLYHTYEGLIPPEEDMTTIYTDGCTEALAEDLAHLFG